MTRLPDGELPPYRPAPRWRSGHLQSVWASQIRHVPPVAYRRETLDLPDGDVLDLDRASVPGGSVPGGSVPGGSRRVVLIAHGLEGSSQRTYVRGMALAFLRRGWDAVAWNLRGCSGRPNKLLRAYHSGATEDLDAVVQHVLAEDYEVVGLVGFSLGGNLTLKYVGDLGASIDARVVAAVGISVPVDLAGSAEVMARVSRRPYMIRFMRSLAAKAEEKATRFSHAPSTDGMRRMRTFRDFDGRFTAPVHGFASADDYWMRASALPVLGNVRIPTLLVNALDDPFLAPSCYPRGIDTPLFRLLTPAHGGHVGFLTPGPEAWSETVATMWLNASV